MEDGEEEGVLLYYKYAQVPDLQDLLRFYDSSCRSLRLLGRVRLAPNGVNVTIGGKMSSLEKHVSELKSMSLFVDTDFKLARCDGPSDDKIANECGFSSLSIRIVKELVTFSSDPLLKSPDISNAGRHLSAADFHSLLQHSGNSSDFSESLQKKVIVVDARNIYETRIGKFQVPGVETLDPEIRQYSDLPSWIDGHSEQLREKHVLMYCTGGIRCEMASAYIRSKGAGYENVFQLFGGIQRYLLQFPDGGFFKGKKFVFDHRISVGSQDPEVLGACLLCGAPFDDYSSRCRCNYCRMLVLVCYDCQHKPSTCYVCELCQRNGKFGASMPLTEEVSSHSGLTTYCSEAPVTEPSALAISIPPEIPGIYERRSPCRKLRVLCLHGFRQNASSFKGRTSALAKKLKSIVDFCFIDAPHELPFIYQPCSGDEEEVPPLDASLQQQGLAATEVMDSSRPRPPADCRRRFAWLIARDSKLGLGDSAWLPASGGFDPLQYQQQTEGLEESCAHLASVISERGPFDGVLGFSQGAAMVALLLLCSKQHNGVSVGSLRFAILCSGFPLLLPGLPVDAASEPIPLPSLHIFGGKGEDRQVSRQASMELASLFDKGRSVIIKHDMGHIIPTRPPHIDRMKDFLLSFL